MTPRTLTNLLAVRDFLVTGRAYAARETLETVIRELGGLPMGLTNGPAQRRDVPSWMEKELRGPWA